MHELEEKEHQNKVLSERIIHLETSLNEKKVSFLCHLDPYFELVFLVFYYFNANFSLDDNFFV
jgi:hypothetical protein